MKKAIDVTIMGQKFQVRSDSNEEYVVKIASYVDKKLNEVLQSTKSVASMQVALLGAMNIADEFFKYQDDRQKKLSDVEDKIKDMIELVDTQI
ncbi:MAG: cell division protein ZapA [Gammaproteobacteria bacterium]|nr:cell division protein ZapA [Gammaproteobacteria bacterium]